MSSSINDTIKEYNNYLSQLEMILHPNIYNAYLKIHHKLVQQHVEEAKTFKPCKEWVELKELVDKMNRESKDWQPVRLKAITRMVKAMPKDNGWPHLTPTN